MQANPDNGWIQIESIRLVGFEFKGISFPGFFPVLPTFFSGTPLDSRYEQWNFEFNQSSAF
jgi:hypothetical protein